MFQPAILAAARKLRPSWRGELEITEAIQALIDDGARVESQVVTGWWKDTGHLEDMLEANRLVLEEIEPRLDGEAVDSKIEGRVVVEKRGAGRAIERARAGDHRVRARITDTYIGPYTSVGEGVEIACSEVEHSIILSGSRVSDLGARMEASLLGRNVRLERSDGPPQTLRLLVGDNSEIAIV